MIRHMMLTALTATSLVACSSTEVVRAPLDVTIGKQLIDLKEAHDKGALNKSEYDDQRRRLINSVK